MRFPTFNSPPSAAIRAIAKVHPAFTVIDRAHRALRGAIPALRDAPRHDADCHPQRCTFEIRPMTDAERAEFERARAMFDVELAQVDGAIG